MGGDFVPSHIPFPSIVPTTTAGTCFVSVAIALHPFPSSLATSDAGARSMRRMLESDGSTRMPNPRDSNACELRCERCAKGRASPLSTGRIVLCFPN